MRDQSVIKGKQGQIGIRPSWSLILGEQKQKREEEERRREEEEEEEEEEERYGILWVCMETRVLYGILWVCMETICVWIFGLLYGY